MNSSLEGRVNGILNETSERIKALFTEFEDRVHEADYRRDGSAESITQNAGDEEKHRIPGMTQPPVSFDDTVWNNLPDAATVHSLQQERVYIEDRLHDALIGFIDRVKEMVSELLNRTESNAEHDTSLEPYLVNPYELDDYHYYTAELKDNLVSERLQRQTPFETLLDSGRYERSLETPLSSGTIYNGYRYLVGKLGINSDMLIQVYNQNDLYETLDKKHIAFVSRDDSGAERSVYVCPIPKRVKDHNEQQSVQAPGSDNTYPFVIKGRDNAKTVCVYNSPVEMISHMTLKQAAHKDISNSHHIAMCGDGSGSEFYGIARFLNSHPGVNRVNLCLDNNQQSFEVYNSLGPMMATRGYRLDYELPKHEKFHEDLLQHTREETIISTEEMEL